MTLKKTACSAPADTEGFSEPVHVQGGTMRTRGRERWIESGGRFKLSCEERAQLFVLSGEGYIKWARGETPFAAGDGFFCEGEGELDLYGACTLIWVRE